MSTERIFFSFKFLIELNLAYKLQKKEIFLKSIYFDETREHNHICLSFDLYVAEKGVKLESFKIATKMYETNHKNARQESTLIQKLNEN